MTTRAHFADGIVFWFALLMVPGCGWKVQLSDRVDPALISVGVPIADRIVLLANENGVSWGGGSLGTTVRERFLQKAAFREVYYPIEPENPPQLRLVITAQGHIEEAIGSGIVKSVIIGALLFLPVAIIQFDKTFVLDSTAQLMRSDSSVTQLHYHIETEVSHTMFSSAEEYEPAARKAAFDDLADQIIRDLRRSNVQE